MSEYSLHGYGTMIRDRVRTDTYAQAVGRIVRPGSVVLDIGAGSGILSMLAARSGARRVFAVEPDDIIEVGRAFAAANRLTDRIEFIQNVSTRIALPEVADVIVSDIRGVLPHHRAHIPSIVDARTRHLAKFGTLIPFRDTLRAAPAELPSVYEDRISSWEATPYGLDLSAARSFAANRWRRVSAPAESLLTDPEILTILDYRTISSPDLESSTEFEAIRPGSFHGLVVWFDTELAEGLGFSNAPGEAEKIYGQGFFPLVEPVDLTAGDVISFDLSASLFGDEYVFRWDTRVTEPSNRRRVKAAFTQSTLFASPFSPESLARLGEDYAPARTEDGEAVSFVLERMDGRRTLADLSQEVEGGFPGLFRSSAEALSFVTKLTQKYCR